MTHWTQVIKTENAALRKGLDAALLALRTIPLSRFDKYREAGDSEHAMAYRKAIQEVDRLAQATIEAIHDDLTEQGVALTDWW